MEFYFSSDEEINIDYDKYEHSPYTDPSVVKKLLRVHFSRKPKKRNREVARAFEMKCSLYQFMHPELSRDEVRAKALNDVQTSSSSVTNNTTSFKQHLLTTIQMLHKTEFTRCKTSKKIDVDESQVQNVIIESGLYVKKEKKPVKQNNTSKPSQKTKISVKKSKKPPQSACLKIDLSNTNCKENHVKSHPRIGMKVSHSNNKTKSEKRLTDDDPGFSTTNVLSTSVELNKPTNPKSDKQYLGNEIISKSYLTDKSMPNNFAGEYTKPLNVGENRVIAVKPSKKRRKNKKIESQVETTINSGKTKVSQEEVFCKMVATAKMWKKVKLTKGHLQKVDSLGMVKYERDNVDRTEGNTVAVNPKKQESAHKSVNTSFR